MELELFLKKFFVPHIARSEFTNLDTLLKLAAREEGTHLYELYRHVPHLQVGFLRCFGLKTGIHFTHFGLELGKVYKATTRVYERIYRFNSK